MYVIDITRNDGSTDMLCGHNSMDAKNKTLDYIIDYALANHNVSIDKDLLDQNLDINCFLLSDFLNENYSINIDSDLIIQSIITDKNNCLFLKYQDETTNIPLIYNFNKKQMNDAENVLVFLVNDGLIQKYKDNISEYERRKLDYNRKIVSTSKCIENIKCDIIPLYDEKGLFLEELLNSSCSLNQINNINIDISI